MIRSAALSFLLTVPLACGGGGGPSVDGAAGPGTDGAAGVVDGGGGGGGGADGATAGADGSIAGTIDGGGGGGAADAGAPDGGWVEAEHVHIYIDNFCNVSAEPDELTVPAGETLQLTWHNHSVDYDADVWLSYGGGFLGLPIGQEWEDQFEFCASPGPYDAAGDVSIAGGPSDACPGFRVWIHCE